MLLLRNLTYRNSDADTANVEKSITQGYIQCRDFTTVASSKTKMVQIEKLTTKGGKYALSLQIPCPGYIIASSTYQLISKYYMSKMFNKSSHKSLVNICYDSGADAGGFHCCQCSTPKWLTLISRVEFSFLKKL